MKDLIDRQAAIKTLEKGLPSEPLKSKYTEGITVGFGLAITWIEQLPAVQPQRKTGKWIVSHIPDSMLWECNQCGFDCGAHSFNFCPNCGADMRIRGEQNG